ncbi:hypothetical protein TB2_039772 [Malus domestica]
MNSRPRCYIHPTRGLRQGDPLSPYLFLLCVEGLSGLIAKQEREGKLQGISICANAPSINHLLFADDSLLFCRAIEAECHHISELLLTYKLASGQQVNLAKSEVCLSKNVKRAIQLKLANALGVQRVERHERYMGMPTLVGRNKSACFAYIKE